jgi:plastocyanin
MYNYAHRGLKLLLLSASLILGIALLAAACSGGDDDDGGSGETPAADETPADDDDNAGPVSFDISMGDTLEPAVTNFFELNEFTVSPGQEVTFNITNDGIAIHNMRVDGGDGEYDTDDDTVSDPDLFQAGDAGTLVWTAPDEAGEIIFRCDFHPADMIGTISVE